MSVRALSISLLLSVLTVTVAEAVEAPTGLSATTDRNSVTLQWDEVSDATGYRLHYGREAGSLSGVLELGDVSLRRFDTLPSGRYYAALAAYDGSGESALSETIAVTVGLVAPAGFEASTYGSMTTLTWEEVPAAKGYRLHYGFEPGHYVGAMELGRVHYQLFRNLPGGLYYVALSAYDEGRESPPGEEVEIDAGFEGLAWNPFGGGAGECQGHGPVRFQASPLELDVIDVVQPQGELTGIVAGHITPGDHIGFTYAASPDQAYDLRAPGDGYIVGIERHPYTPPDGFPADLKNYHLYFEYSCGFFSNFVRIDALAPDLVAADPELQQLDAEASLQGGTILFPRIPVSAGQVIGSVQSHGLLGMLTVDKSTRRSHYVIPARYNVEPWKVHSVAPFDYYDEPLRGQLLAKNPRTAEPRGGRIDFDIDGRLSGNWFMEGTEDYGGGRLGGERLCDGAPCPYWYGHLAFVYDYVDPAQARVNIGFDPGFPVRGPFGVRDAAFDPAAVGVDDGLVLLELMPLERIDAQGNLLTDTLSPYTRPADDDALAVMAVQLIDDRTLKMELFESVEITQITGFTDAALTYRR